MKKDNKRMKITTYIKRIIAVAVSTAMLISMTPEVFAESLSAPESAISDPPVEETITENTQSDSQPVATDESTGSAVSESTGTEETEGSVGQSQETTPEESTGTGESDGSTDRDSVASAEETTETISSDDEASEEFISEETTEMPPEDLVEDESEIELLLNLLAEGDSTIRTSPSLSLSDALNIAGTGNSTVLSESGNTLSVTGSKGLILLSNVKPEEYKDKSISLTNTEGGFNLTETQDFTYTTSTEGETESTQQTAKLAFLGLGDTTNPYAGTLSFANASNVPFLTNRALFNAISTSATLPNTISFLFTSESNNVNAPLLAEEVANGNDNTLTCGVTLTVPTSGEVAEISATIGGIIGTLGENAKANVTLTNNLTGTLTVSGGNNRGLFCNTMASGSSLTANLTNSGTISVIASTGDAGGYVGHMDGNNTLTISGSAVNTVTSNSGNAGGLVGSATYVAINVTNGTFSLSGVTITATNGNAGGLVGDYTNTNTITTDDTLNLAQFTLDTTLSGGTNAGGVFGALTNSGNYTISDNAVSSSLTGASGNYGGLIGTYSATKLSAALTISGINGDNKITSTGNNATTYGGVIGTVSGSSYVAMDDVSVSTAAMPTGNSSCFGGLVGKMENGLLNVGNVTLVVLTNNKGVPIYDISADDVGGRGGLVGYIAKGVLRLHGTTDLTNQKITAAYHHTGQIVGNNGNGLVYATGSGNSLDADGNGWLLKRYNPDSNSSRSGSDIGNWGEVVRLDGMPLTEGADGLLTFDSNAHTVKVQGASVTTGDDGTQSVTLTNTRDFAAYALAFDLDSNTNYNGSDSNAVLSFATKVDPSASQTVNLSANVNFSANVNLTGTGILGIGRDDNSDNKPFIGNVNGNGNTITLDIGSPYGKAGDTDASGNGSGQIYAKRADGRDAHYSLALFPYGKGITVKDLTVAGSGACTIGNSAQKENDVRSPILAAAVVGQAEGTTEFNNVTVNADVSVADISNNKNIYAVQGGFLGLYKSDASGNAGTLTFRGCQWTNKSTLSNTRTNDYNRIGGFAGMVFGGGTSVTVSGCALSGEIEANMTSNAAVGGLIAESRNDYIKSGNNLQTSDNSNSISISTLTISGEKIRATAATGNCGGLLGYSWNKTDVTFGGTTTNSEGTSITTTGVTISNCNLNANSAKFGGLVYQATGYWNATAANSIHFTGTNTITGGTNQNAPSGLLVGTGLITSNNQNNALYLEVGTWGSATDAAYTIDSRAVTLTNTRENFDELVGKTIQDNAGHDNAVVSLAVRESGGTTAAKIDPDTDTCNTYKGQIDNFKNGKTRYYYNLDSYRTSGESGSAPSADSLNTPGKVLSWSVSQYAAGNIRSYFCSNSSNGATISGTIDLTGYSYYPVSPLGTVTVGSEGIATTTLTFAYKEMNGKETGNKTFNDNTHQHHLMHHGLLYDTGSNVTVNNTTFAGTVGQLSSNGGSGALIFGSVTGDPTKNPVEVKLTDVTLAGLCVADVAKDTTTYAPLLINKITQIAKLNVTDLSTYTGYVDESNNTTYAATSLIGRVGSSDATKLTLTFTNIALDGRLAADANNSTSVYNNGTVEVNYHTTHTIFTHATLLESFMYKSEGSGTYTFNSTDSNVTYGVELSNSGESGRNPNKQYQYYDAVVYVTDESGKTDANEDYVKGRYTETNFIRYVYVQQKVSESKYELDINQKTIGLLKGCGTYGDPYIIKDPNQLISLAYYFAGDGKSKGFEVVFNSKVLSKKKQTSTSYHIKDGATTDDTGTDTAYRWDGSSWKDGGGNAADSTTALQYLLNAYYKIEGEITLPAEQYSGLGTLTNPFSGVIVGENNNTVSIKGDNDNKTGFGGLIAFSRGSVVKDLTVDYSKATITMTNSAVPSSSNNPFFGGVVGYCMGGDTIIDNVSVNYGESSVTLSSTNGQKPRLIAAGGYVGLVGGAKDSSGYEKTGGGVVFRNMGNCTNNFEDTLSCASENPSTLVPDSDNYAKEQTDQNYFFCNPYVGRVLDGYACYDGGTAGQSTLNNTDKNYTIPDVPSNDGGLTVTQNTDGSLTATVSTAQGLWLLSAIVNSGAGAMDSSGKYTDYDGGTVDAYQIGKPRSRTADYSKIGTSITTDAEKVAALADEIRWGGVPSGTTAGQDTTRVSYLVSGFTSNNAAQLTGRSSTTNKNSANNPVSLTFGAFEIDMQHYGNGFRGIGASYTVSANLYDNNNVSLPKNYRRALLVKGINADSARTTTIKLNMSQREYHPGGQDTDYESGFWNQGAGLFTAFSYTGNTQVKNLTLSGTVCLNTFDLLGKLSRVMKKNYDFCVGGFAGLISNYSGTVTFTDLTLDHLYVYGGTTTGGVFGITSKAELDFSSFTISDVEVIKTVTTDGSIGGLVGLKQGTVTIGTPSTETSPVEPSVISNLTVKMFGTKTTSQSCGGLIGCSDGGNLTIQNIQATGLTVHGEDTRDVGGLISGFRKGGTLTISDCELTDLTVTYKANTNDSEGDDNRNVGGLVGFVNQTVGGISNVRIHRSTMSVIKGNSLGGFVGQTKNDITLDDCHIMGSLNMQEREKPYLGGMVGCSSAVITIKNCTETSLNILSEKSDAGGLVGQMKGGSTNVSNVSFSNVNVVTKTEKDKKSVGLLTGNTNGFPINGFNILADTCTAGYNTSATIDDLGTITSDGKYNGIWLGGSKGSGNNSKLVAVAVDGVNQPHKDVGISENGSVVDVIYADYPVYKDYQPKDENGTPKSADPWLDVNPDSNVTLGDGTIMTGNGVGYMTTTTTLTDEEGKQTTTTVKGNSIAQTILEEVASTDTNIQKKYWNLTEKYPEFIKTSSETSNGVDSYVTTYQGEEKGNTSVPSTTDFPILVVSGLAKDDTEIWNYIAALTNVKGGDTAKGQVAEVTAATYKWTKAANATEASDGTFAGSFVKQNGSSLTVNSTDKKTISITPNAYDNQQRQFTLLDVKYTDPTNSSNAFHLYVPVLVKKVLYVSFSAKFLAGTNYRKDAYEFPKGTTTDYATAGFNEPVTVYFEYNYQRAAEEWNTMLANGDSLQWSYDKVLNLAAVKDKTLPDGTRLTLVDRRTGQYYTHTWDNSKDDVHNFNLSTMVAPDGATHFSPVPIGNLLGLKATLYSNGAYVRDNTGGTISIGENKYRLPNEGETGEYTITVDGSLIDENGYLRTGEGYYLTIQVLKPSSEADSTVVNNPMRCSSWKLENKAAGAPLAYIKEKYLGQNDVVTYVIYDGVRQSAFTISTARNGDSTLDTKMEDGDSIRVTLTSTLSLTSAGRDNFFNYAPTKLYHQFNINMKKYLKDTPGVAALIGATGASYTYTITQKDNKELYNSGYQLVSDSATLDTLPISCNNEKAAENMVNYLRGNGPNDNTERTLTIQAVITLPYPTLGTYFPGRSSSDASDQSGISVSADSRVATATTQLPITTHKETANDSNRYYTENPSSAKLTYNTYDGDGTGDSTRKLGINPSDTINDLDGLIYTNGVYDYSGVDAETLSHAKQIKYTLELFQKDDNGSYNESSPLGRIDEYLPSVTVTGEDKFVDSNGKQAKTLTKAFPENPTGHDSINIKLKPLTGAEFEAKNFTYANYKVRLTAVMLKEDGTELPDTKASDYIIYTNARIYQQMISQAELSSTSG